MMYRVLIGAGLFLLGYYVGKEVKLKKPVRKQMQETDETLAEENTEQQTAEPIMTE
jgi:hypothetical protein